MRTVRRIGGSRPPEGGRCLRAMTTTEPDLHQTALAERTYVLEVELGSRVKETAPREILRLAATTCLKWCADKAGSEPTPAMLALSPDTMDGDGLHSLRTVGRIEDGVWAARLQYADKDRGAKRAVAGRSWRSEIVLREINGKVRVRIQLSMSARKGVDRSYIHDRPTLVVSLESELGLWDKAPVAPVVTPLAASALLQLAKMEGRSRSVVVLTESKEDDPGFSYTLDQDALGPQMLGIAWVVRLSREETFRWTETAGRRWAAFDGVVLVLRPGWDPVEDEARFHRRYFPDYISDFEHRGLRGEEAFRSYLAEQCVHDLCAVRDEGNPKMSFDGVLAEELERQRGLQESGERLPIVEEQRRNLERRLQEQEEALALVQMEHDELKRALRSVAEEAGILRAQAQHWQAIAEKRESSLPGEDKPKSLAEIGDWCSGLVTKLVLLPRARRLLKKGEYEDVGLVVEALKLLASEGWDYFAGEAGGRDRFLAKCHELGLDNKKSISDTSAGREGDTYFVEYPHGRAEKRKLEWHLCKGTDRDPRTCLRIYYFWDKEARVIVVGALPGHLDNSLT